VAAVIFAAIVALSLVIAFMASRVRDMLRIDEYLVGGRAFSGFLLFFLAVGESYSISTMVGLPGGIHAGGAGYGIWFLGYIVLAYSFGYFLTLLVWRAGEHYGAMTTPDVLKGHYRSRTLEVLAALTALVFLVPWAQLQFAGLQVVFGALGFGISPTTAVILAGFVAFLYKVVSGVQAPANVSILKDILLFGALVMVGVAAVYSVGSVSRIFEEANGINAGALAVGSGEPLVFALTTIIFQAAGFYVVPLTLGFIFTARSEATVRRTMIPMPLYMLMYPFLILAAYQAVSAAPNLEDPNTAFFVVAVFLVVSVALQILAPTLMLALINTAYYGFTQFLPGFVGVFFMRRFTSTGVAGGLIAGNTSILLLYASGLTLGGVNIGLVSLLVNFAVTFAVSAATKNSSPTSPIATNPPRPVREGA